MSIYTPPQPATRPAMPNAPTVMFPRVPVPTTPATPRPSVRASWAREGWTSPRVLQALLLASLLGAVLLFAAGTVAYTQLRNAAQEVGRDSVPSVLAALQIQASLVDMDANAANDLLAGANGSRTARDSFEAQRSIIGRQITRAASDLSYGNAERVPLETLQDGMTYYTQLIAQARTQIRQNPNGTEARDTYAQASDFLKSTLVPAAERLETVNRDAFRSSYVTSGTTSTLITALVLLAGAVLLAVLVGAQLYLSRHTRRTLNPALLVASALLALFLLNTLDMIATQREALRVANDDAFASLNVLWRARAAAYDANGDQTLFLLYPQNAARYQQQFNEKTGRIVNQPVNDALVQAAGQGRITFSGYLADELRTTTDSTERDAALAALREFGGYQGADARIRQLNGMGEEGRRQALALATGTNVDQSRRSFERFDSALTRAIGINQTGFDGAVNRAFAAVEPLQWQTPLAALVVALLAFAGLQPRMREYAV